MSVPTSRLGRNGPKNAWSSGSLAIVGFRVCESEEWLTVYDVWFGRAERSEALARSCSGFSASFTSKFSSDGCRTARLVAGKADPY